jgi:hypothetical protein
MDTTDSAAAAHVIGIEFGLAVAAFANKWGGVGLDRFGDAWRSAVQTYARTIVEATIASIRLNQKIETEGSSGPGADERQGTPEHDLMICLAIQYGATKEFVEHWVVKLPRRRMEEFGHDVSQFGDALRELAKRAALAVEGIGALDPVRPPPAWD